MKQIDNISEALTDFRLAAATQVVATESDDYKKSNNAFDRIIQILKYLKGLGKTNELEALLSDSNVGVRMFAAYGLLPTYPKIAVPILKEISLREDISSLTAKTTLEQWEQNTLIYPFQFFFVTIMNKWQKIVGVITFGAIGIYELLLCANTYVDLKYIIEPYDISDIIDRMYLRADALSASLWLNYFIALFIFICLWRKGGKR